MKLSQVLVAVCLMLGFPHDCTGQRYAFMAPRIVRPHSTYEIVVTNVAESVQQFRCELVNSKNIIVQSQQVRVDPNQIEQANISTGSLAEGKYQLRVWNENENQLLNSSDLTYSRKSYMVLFQTDKPQYKPGDKVQFRVLFLLPNAKPVQKDVTASIFITNAIHYRMQQWTNATLRNGVFEGSFQLAQHTALGAWSINALINEQHYTDSFNVAEYTLPIFKVKVEDIPESFYCEAPEMKLRITANYMGGGMLRGNVTVVVRANYNTYPSQTKEFARKVSTFSGADVVQFPTNIIGANCDEERKVWFDVNVTDSLTGVSYNLTRMFKVYNILYTMDALGEFEAFHPGVPMNLKIRLSSVDGVPEKKKTVVIKYKVQNKNQELDDVIPEQVNFETDAGGIIQFKIDTTEDTEAVVVEGLYKKSIFPLVYAQPFYEDQKVEFLSAYTGAVYHYVSGNIRLYLNSNVGIKRIFYIGYCRQSVCAKGARQWKIAEKKGTIDISALPSMAPQMKLLVFTVKEDGKILSTAIFVQFASIGLDHFSVEYTRMSGTKKQPKQLKFSINSEKGAFIGLLGVDERITLRESSNNDITMQKMEKAMQAQEDSMGMWSAYDSFGSVGVALLTDGYLPDVGFVPHFSSRLADDDDDEVKVREDFPETWIWESKTASNGMEAIEKRVPDTMTTWVVTGFSVGEEHGLVILKEPLHIEVSKDVYAQLHMPAAIKRREEVDALCLIHNDGKSIEVTVEGLPKMREKRRFLIASGATQKIPFKLVAEKSGTLTVKVVVRSINGNVIDAMQQSVTVHPDGEVKVVEDVRLVNYVQKTTGEIALALSALDGEPGCSGAEVKLSVIGTIVNLNQFDLERLVATSYGNGEENLLFLQTTIAVYEYLAATEHLSESRKNKLVGYMEIAYQQHLRFRLADGSFSMFGSVRKCGGTWLTAATVETLLKATAYLSVDSSVITGGLNWLAAKLQDDGSFNESCTIAHPHIQSSRLSLASSVMFAFVGHRFSQPYTEVIKKTISMLTREQIEDVYVLAKTTYLLSVIDHQSWTNMRDRLNKLVTDKDGYSYWSVGDQAATPSAKTQSQGATAYGLLVNLKKQPANKDQLVQMAQWIQQNSFAGELWRPSFEKVVALQALKALNDALPPVVPRMHVVVQSHELQVNSSNRELLQTVTLPHASRNVTVYLEGAGLILLKLSYRCTIPPIGEQRPILARETNGLSAVNIKKTQYHEQMEWQICLSYRIYHIHCPMAILNIYLPTGLLLVKPPTLQHNQTASALSLEHNTRLDLTYDVAIIPTFCVPVRVRNYYPLSSMNRGSVNICSMDAKDQCLVFALY